MILTPPLFLGISYVLYLFFDVEESQYISFGFNRNSLTISSKEIISGKSNESVTTLFILFSIKISTTFLHINSLRQNAAEIHDGEVAPCFDATLVQ